MVITSLGHKVDLVVGRRSALSDSDSVWGHIVGEPVSITSNVNVIVIHCQQALLAMFDHANVDAHYLCACFNVHLCV